MTPELGNYQRKQIITSELQNGKWYGEIKNQQDLSPTCLAKSIKKEEFGGRPPPRNCLKEETKPLLDLEKVPKAAWPVAPFTCFWRLFAQRAIYFFKKMQHHRERPRWLEPGSGASQRTHPAPTLYTADYIISIKYNNPMRQDREKLLNINSYISALQYKQR